MRRMLVAAALASISFASFAGCSQDSPPAPVHTTASCSPASAEVHWGAGINRKQVLVAAYVLTSAGEDGWAVDFPDVGAQPVWDDSGLATVALTDSARDVWHRALIADANRTGQVGTHFGTTPVYDQQHPLPMTPTKPSNHRFVGVTSEDWVTLPFTIRCPGASSTLTGAVSGTSGADLSTAIYQCGAQAGGVAERQALTYCP